MLLIRVSVRSKYSPWRSNKSKTVGCGRPAFHVQAGFQAGAGQREDREAGCHHPGLRRNKGFDLVGDKLGDAIPHPPIGFVSFVPSS